MSDVLLDEMPCSGCAVWAGTDRGDRSIGEAGDPTRHVALHGRLLSGVELVPVRARRDGPSTVPVVEEIDRMVLRAPGRRRPPSERGNLTRIVLSTRRAGSNRGVRLREDRNVASGVVTDRLHDRDIGIEDRFLRRDDGVRQGRPVTRIGGSPTVEVVPIRPELCPALESTGLDDLDGWR